VSLVRVRVGLDVESAAAVIIWRHVASLECHHFVGSPLRELAFPLVDFYGMLLLDLLLQLLFIVVEFQFHIYASASLLRC
jgi:hypothetical protein